MSDRPLNTDEYRTFLQDVKQRIQAAQIKAAVAVNRELLQLYWELAERIVAKQQESAWGGGFLERMSRDLQKSHVYLRGSRPAILCFLFIHGFAYEEYFGVDTGTKRSMILAAGEHILGLENGRKRYINEVAALSQAFAIAVPHEQAMDVKDEVAFFQAVKAGLVKFDVTGPGKTDEEIETAIRQAIDQALVSEQVIDVFDAAGLKKVHNFAKPL